MARARQDRLENRLDQPLARLPEALLEALSEALSEALPEALLEALLETLPEGFPEDFLQGIPATAIQPGFNESPQHTRRIATVWVSLASTQPRAAAGAEDHPASHPRSCPEGAAKLRRLATGESW
jgi:hypothetical protein